MFKGLGNIASLLKQAQTLGPQMSQRAEELKKKRIVGTAGGGMININADGSGHVMSVEIDQLLRDKGDMEMIQDLLPAAINDVAAKAKSLQMEMMHDVAGGMSLPAGMDDMLKQFTGQMESVDENDSDEIEGEIVEDDDQNS